MLELGETLRKHLPHQLTHEASARVRYSESSTFPLQPIRTTTSVIIVMTVLLPSSSPIELCNRSSSVLATRDRIAPGVLPVSLREHPIWGLLVTHEGSAYEHDCKVADAYRHDSGFIWIGIDINVEDRAQSSLPLALLDRKKDELLEAYSPVEFWYSLLHLPVEHLYLIMSIASSMRMKL